MGDDFVIPPSTRVESELFLGLDWGLQLFEVLVNAQMKGRHIGASRIPGVLRTMCSEGVIY